MGKYFFFICCFFLSACYYEEDLEPTVFDETSTSPLVHIENIQQSALSNTNGRLSFDIIPDVNYKDFNVSKAYVERKVNGFLFQDYFTIDDTGVAHFYKNYLTRGATYSIRLGLADDSGNISRLTAPISITIN
jgi:hypothetical protein